MTVAFCFLVLSIIITNVEPYLFQQTNIVTHSEPSNYAKT